MSSSQNLVALNPSTGASGLLNLSTIEGNNALFVTDVNAKSNLEDIQVVIEEVRDSIIGNNPTLLKPVSLIDATDNAGLTLADDADTHKMSDVSRVMNVNIFYEDTTPDGAGTGILDNKVIAVMGRLGGSSTEIGETFISDGSGGTIKKTDYTLDFAAPSSGDEVDVELFRFSTKSNSDNTKNLFFLSDLNVRGISRVYLKNVSGTALTGVKVFVAGQF